MNRLDTIRETMAAFLREQGLDAVCAWPEKNRTGGGGAVVAVSLRACQGGPAGFQDYLGERYNQEAGRWEELYGRKISLTFGLDLYAGRGAAAGAAEIERAFDRLTQAFAQGGPTGIRLLTLSRGESGFDQNAGRFQCAAEAVCEGFLYAVADEAGAFLDFEVRGVPER